MLQVSISIDDGRKDTHRAYFEVMKKLGIPLTVNITTGYIDGMITEAECPCQNEAMNYIELSELIEDENVEVAGHGYAHNNDIDNLIHGIKDLEKLLKGTNKKIYGMASPQSRLRAYEIENYKNKLDALEICYVRTGDRKENMGFHRRLLRKINRFVHIPAIFYYSDFPQFMKMTDSYILYSNCILKNTTIDEIKYSIQKLSKMESMKGCILNFHSILHKGEPYYDDLYSWDYQKFQKLCSYLNRIQEKDEIKLCMTKDMINFK